MHRALAYVRTRQPRTRASINATATPPAAARRTDWIGFDNCIRNHSMARAHRAR